MTTKLVLMFTFLLTQTYCLKQDVVINRQAGVGDPGNPSRGQIHETKLGRIRHLTSLLSSENEKESDEAQKELINLANQDSSTRQVVVDELISTAERLRLGDNAVLEPPSFRFWSGASEIFSKLRAVESIDLLINLIYCSDGMSNETASHRPAEDALIAMAELAVPKLAEALLHTDNPAIKRRVAICLGNVGGREARRALDQALQTETNQAVIHSIKIALSTIDRQPS